MSEQCCGSGRKIRKEREKMTMRILREKQKGSGVGLWDDGMLIPVMEKFSPQCQTEIVWEATKSL